MLRSTIIALGLWVWAVVGCAPGIDDDLPPAGDRASIVGGSNESGFPLVGMLAADLRDWGYELGEFCTATAVTPTVLITAAHCTEAFYDPNLYGAPIVFSRHSPDGSGPMHRVEKASRVVHPQYAKYLPNAVNDIALVRLNESIDAELFPEQKRTPLRAGDVGIKLKVIGYGVSEPGPTPDTGEGDGTKRSINMTVTQVVGPYFTMVLSDSWRGVCYGDSGGPSFRLGEHRDIQYGVHARTQVESCGPGEDTDVGYFYSGFVEPSVLSLDGSAADCGDGICTGIETEGSCGEDCSPYECGDGAQEGPEACDDGNTRGGDGCSADCLSTEICGNGITDRATGEVCDDDNNESGDGCSADCISDESCGNAIVDALAGEVCDDGNLVWGDGCSGNCASNESCGNGIADVDAGEACDDGNSESGDGCSADCLSDETCGNGYLDEVLGEVCDDGNTVSGDGCSADCRIAEGCGNGVAEINFGEICDDGNTVSGDGCSANCRSDESCGNTVVDDEAGEICDDGNTEGDDDCPFDCGVPSGPLPGLVGYCNCRAVVGQSTQARALLRLLL